MTLTSELNRVEYSPDGNDVSFAITFVFWEDDDPLLTLKAVDGTEEAWVRGTQYTITGGSGSTGTATVITSPTDYTPANGTTLVITSNLTDTQDTDLPEGGPFPSSAVEQQMDKTVRMIQQGGEEDNRRLHYPITDLSSLSSEIPNSTDRASAFLAFDSSGVPIASTGPTGDSSIPVSTYIETLLDDLNSAAARATLEVVIGTDVEAADADILKADTPDTLTVGFDATENDAGTKTTGTFTPDPADGNFQKAVNGGAHTLAPPATTTSIVVQYTNNASAGTITTSGFTIVDGDTISTTDADDFLFFITRDNGFSHLHVKALQ